MRQLIQNIFRSTEDRISNPLIGTFITSWVVLNWKPLLFFIFSSQTIEDKIIYIQDNFSNIESLLYWPLVITFLYVIVLPYITLSIELISNYAFNKRNFLETEKTILKLTGEQKVEIKKIAVEKAKQEYTEGKSTNDIIEALTNRINNLQNENSELTLSYNTTIEELRKELKDIKKRENTLISTYEGNRSKAEELIIYLTDKADALTMESNKILNQVVNLKNQITTANNSEKQQLEHEIEILTRDLNALRSQKVEILNVLSMQGSRNNLT